MIDRHWDGLAASCKPENKVALGFVEGVNNTIRVRQRRAYGLRDEESLRVKILTCMLPEILKASNLPTRLREEPVFGLWSLPHVRTLSEADGFLEVYQDVTGTIPALGNLIPDAHLFALLRQYDITLLYSTDTDFRKFTCLTVKNTLVETSK